MSAYIHLAGTWQEMLERVFLTSIHTNQEMRPHVRYTISVILTASLALHAICDSPTNVYRDILTEMSSNDALYVDQHSQSKFVCFS